MEVEQKLAPYANLPVNGKWPHLYLYARSRFLSCLIIGHLITMNSYLMVVNGHEIVAGMNCYSTTNNCYLAAMESPLMGIIAISCYHFLFKNS